MGWAGRLLVASVLLVVGAWWYSGTTNSFSPVAVAAGEEAEEWFQKGEALVVEGRYEEALAAYDGAIRLKPDYAVAWHNKGATLDRLGRHEEELSAYDEAIRLSPDTTMLAASTWRNKGLVLSDLGRNEEGTQWLCEAWRARDRLSDKGARLEQELRDRGVDPAGCANVPSPL